MPWVLLGTGVAAGLADAAVIAGHPMATEDLAPMPVLLAEAGGRVTDLAGGDVLAGAGDVLISNGHDPRPAARSARRPADWCATAPMTPSQRRMVRPPMH